MKPRVASILLLVAITAACRSIPTATMVPEVANAVSPMPGLVTGGRLEAVDMPRLRAAGIATVIDLSLDSETPAFDEAAAVRAAGIRYVNLPLRGGVDLTRENVLAFDALLRESPRPLLVHCASGNRVGAMAALRAAWVEGRSADEAIGIGREWGLKGLEDAVREKLAASASETVAPH
jgi:uncharacterized protein (TIGR01244 family)